MTITDSNIKIYRCQVWTEGDSHGGDIDINNEIISGADQNIFDDVTDDEMNNGVYAWDIYAYRKIYIKNLNTETWVDIKTWIYQKTDATNDEVEIALETNNNNTVWEVKEGGTNPLIFTRPYTRDAGLVIPNLAQNAYQGIWLRRIVSPGGTTYEENSFKLIYEGI